MMLGLLLAAAVASPVPDAVEIPEAVATNAFVEWRRARGESLPVVAVDRATNQDAVLVVRQASGAYLSVHVDADRTGGPTVTTEPVVPPAEGASPATPFLGRYEGRSLCLANKPVCKDEVVVYTLGRAWSRARPVRMQADKVVDGAPQLMGIVDCAVEGEDLRCPMSGGEWVYHLKGDHLDGSGTWRGVHVREVSTTRVR